LARAINIKMLLQLFQPCWQRHDLQNRTSGGQFRDIIFSKRWHPLLRERDTIAHRGASLYSRIWKSLRAKRFRTAKRIIESEGCKNGTRYNRAPAGTCSTFVFRLFWEYSQSLTNACFLLWEYSQSLTNACFLLWKYSQSFPNAVFLFWVCSQNKKDLKVLLPFCPRRKVRDLASSTVDIPAGRFPQKGKTVFIQS
jgi:hypothetical protein